MANIKPISRPGYFSLILFVLDLALLFIKVNASTFNPFLTDSLQSKLSKSYSYAYHHHNKCPAIAFPSRGVLRLENIPQRYKDMDYTANSTIYFRRRHVSNDLENVNGSAYNPPSYNSPHSEYKNSQGSKQECRFNEGINNKTIPGQVVLKLESIKQSYKDMDYSMRGAIYFRSLEIQQQLKNGVTKPFSELIQLHLGDSQGGGQKPITFVRQVLGLVSYPKFIETSHFIPTDVIMKAQNILQECGSVGSYSDSMGLELVRKNVAKFLTQRDGGIISNFEDIILTDGVSNGVSMFMELFQDECNKINTGFMVPHPVYPLYSSLLKKYNFRQINYYLNETNNWELETEELERAYQHGLCNCDCKPRAIFIINPGNPTSKMFTRRTIESIVKFAYTKNLVILADEIYQEVIHRRDIKFESFKKVIMELGAPYNTTELVSFHSISKGYMSECGLRGGFFELINSDPKIRNILFQLLSKKQCPNLIGQVALNSYVDPPRLGDPSYDLYEKEKTESIQSTYDMSIKMAQELNKLEGYNCTRIDAGSVAFTKITLPFKAIKAAEASGSRPDVFYGLQLLENTGFTVAVGSSFGLTPSQTYLRITIPGSWEKLNTFLKLIRPFHEDFMKKYSV